jgi:hypothetical protein
MTNEQQQPTAAAIPDRLDRGVVLLGDAGQDQDLLGVALLAFQGGLAERLRELVSTNPTLTDEGRAALERATTILALVDLARRHGDLTREQAWRIIEAERLRAEFVRGDPFRGSPNEVRSYGRFVAAICARPEIDQILATMPLGQTATTPSTDGDEDDVDQPPQGFYYTIMRWVPGLLFMAVLAFAGWALIDRIALRQAAPARPLGPTATLPALTFAPITVSDATSVSLPTPTIATRRGQIVRLGGNPGWLHSEPRFDSPTLAIQLSEGMEVAILGQQQVDAQGVLWMLVATGGYEGWSPVNNVEEVR